MQLLYITTWHRIREQELTVQVLFGYYLLAFSNGRFLSRLNRAMPFLDAFHAPYKRGNHYWIGILLLVQCALLLVFALNTPGSDNVNLIAITSVTAGLMAVAWLRGRIYIKFYNDTLEAFFFLNLHILSAATYHVKMTGENKAKIAFTSVGIVFTFFVVFIFHTYLMLMHVPYLKMISTKVTNLKFYMQWNKNKITSNVTVLVRYSQLPTTSVIEISELEEYTA